MIQNPHLLFRLFRLAALVVLAAVPAWAQAPTTLHYQGRLLHQSVLHPSGGTPAVQNTVDIVFSIWTGPSTDGSAMQIWQEAWNGVALVNGIFNVELGSKGSPFNPADFQADASLYLQLEIDDEVLEPRQQLGSAAFAFVDEPGNERQDLSLNNDILALSASSSTVDLASYLDNTDAQTLSLDETALNLSDSGASVDLSALVDNTDDQDLALSDSVLSLEGDPTSVDLSSLLDNTDLQTLGLSDSTLTISGSGSAVDLAPFIDNTDAQTLSLLGDTLEVSGTGSTVDLAGADAVTQLLSRIAELQNKLTRTAFVSSTSHNGNLGGLAGADAICQGLAEGAGLEGRYMAWLSDSTGSPSTRFSRDDRPFVLPNGVRLADDWDDLTDGTIQVNFDRTQTGSRLSFFKNVWTATLTNGTRNTDSTHCSNWSIDTITSTGVRVGRTTHTNAGWTEQSFNNGCGASYRLYCFEQ